MSDPASVNAQSPKDRIGELPGLQPEAIVEQADSLGQEAELRAHIRTELERERGINRLNAARQFEQVVLWRRINLAIGLLVGLLVAASGTTGFVTKGSPAAAVLAALATFGTGALTTLNAGQKKTQAASAGSGYSAIEADARELLEIDLPYAPTADALTALRDITRRRMLLNATAEPPSARALRKVDRAERERVLYGRRLSFVERHDLLWWEKPPPKLTASTAESGVRRTPGSREGLNSPETNARPE